MDALGYGRSAAATLVLTLLVSFAQVPALAEAPKRQRTHAYDDALFERQYRALVGMPDSINVTYTSRGTIRRIEGATGYRIEEADTLAKGAQAPPQLLRALADVLLAEGGEQLTVTANRAIPGMRSIVFAQAIRGRPVVGGGIVSLGVDASGVIRIVDSYFVPDRGLPRNPTVSKEEATEKGLEYMALLPDVEKASAQANGAPTLAYYAGGPDADSPVLVWVVRAGVLLNSGGWTSREVWVDALSGVVVGDQRRSSAALNRSVYTAHNASPYYGGYPNGLSLLFTTSAALCSLR